MLNRNSFRAVVTALAVLCYAALNNCALGFVDGDVITYHQADWGHDPIISSAAALLQTNYNSVYASTSGLLEVGTPGSAGFSMLFTNVRDLLAYLPAHFASGPLISDLLDPTSSASGSFGGHVTALRINVDFSDAGVTLGNLGIPFGNLQLRNFPVSSNLNDLTVRQILGHANNLLGGGSSLFYSISQLTVITDDLNVAFGDGFVTQWAQDHLRVIPIPGDYNGNGAVDAADYVLWRNGGPLQNDATPGVQPTDYNVWRAKFGQTTGSGSGAIVNAAVPEPTTVVMLIVAAVGVRLRRRDIA